MFGADGLPPGATPVSSSTISVALSKRLTAAHAETRQQYVAAPVFDRLEVATAAKLFVVAAGPLGAAEELAVPLPVASLLGDRYLALLADGGGHLDWPAIAALTGRDAGVRSDHSA